MTMNKPKIMPQNYLAILIGPWIFYYIVFFLFDIKFVSFNGIVIIPIILAIFLSILFFDSDDKDCLRILKENFLIHTTRILKPTDQELLKMVDTKY